MSRCYIAIDLKSFYASVECVERGLDPLTTNLVVADASKTDKTIGLAVSPSLKAFGIPGRPRLFEVVQRVREVNRERRMRAPGGVLRGESCHAPTLGQDPTLAVSYIVAPPRMAKYMAVSTQIYGIYLKYIAPEDMHVYSVDEVFIDVTHYLRMYRCSARELALRMIHDVLKNTGITATAGIGSNLYLAKVAMDILAKKLPPDKDGVRIAELDPMRYRWQLWTHTPITDFWRVGPGYAKKLSAHGMYTMGDVARCSLAQEELLYKLFGVNAELLIDHAWGMEPCLISDIKAYVPRVHSLSSGQVLTCPYAYDKARLIVREMSDLMSLDLVEKGMCAQGIGLDIGYDVTCLTSPQIAQDYHGATVRDAYGRLLPKPVHGSALLPFPTASTHLLTETAVAIFDRIADPGLLIRRFNLTAQQILPEAEVEERMPEYRQIDLFHDPEEEEKARLAEAARLKGERARQMAILRLRARYGKNAVIKGMNLLEGGTTIVRNAQIGGHKA